VLFCLGGGAYALNSSDVLHEAVGPWFLLIVLCASSGVGLFWLFLLTLFEDRTVTAPMGTEHPEYYARFAAATRSTPKRRKPLRQPRRIGEHAVRCSNTAPLERRPALPHSRPNTGGDSAVYGTSGGVRRDSLGVCTTGACADRAGRHQRTH
jgi:hypothetical protein